jgi:hypothetical protein
MDQNQDKKKKVDIIKREITTEEPVIQEVIIEIIGITHLLNKKVNFMCLKTPQVVHKCLMLGLKEEDMNWIVCKES